MPEARLQPQTGRRVQHGHVQEHRVGRAARCSPGGQAGQHARVGQKAQQVGEANRVVGVGRVDERKPRRGEQPREAPEQGRTRVRAGARVLPQKLRIGPRHILGVVRALLGVAGHPPEGVQRRAVVGGRRGPQDKDAIPGAGRRPGEHRGGVFVGRISDPSEGLVRRHHYDLGRRAVPHRYHEPHEALPVSRAHERGVAPERQPARRPDAHGPRRGRRGEVHVPTRSP